MLPMLANIIFGALLLVAIGLAVRSIRKARRSGGSCSSCSGCAHSASCPSRNVPNKHE